jgi:cytochrome c oxidase subunit 2
MFWICTVVWLAVAVAALIAIRRGGRAADADASDRRIGRNVVIAGGVSLVALFGLLFQSVVTGRALDTLRGPGALRIQVTGNQWWWDVQYDDPIPSLRVTTANEIHIPVGRPVAIDLLATDVIHSLWIPNLQGKIDLVPGRRNELWLRADREGVYRGQCAEYCGLQHAKMALVVVADPPDRFEGWLAANRAPAAPPATSDQQRGKAIVEHGPCAMCHNISGTLAGGRTAPDLTHVASRSTLAAGSVPNTPAHLAAWIADPQSLKPGNRMPQTVLAGDELKAVLAYLEILK